MTDGPVYHSKWITLDQDGIAELDLPGWAPGQVNHAHLAHDAKGQVAIVEGDAGNQTRLIIAYGEPNTRVLLCWTERDIPPAPVTVGMALHDIADKAIVFRDQSAVPNVDCRPAIQELFAALTRARL